MFIFLYIFNHITQKRCIKSSIIPIPTRITNFIIINDPIKTLNIIQTKNMMFGMNQNLELCGKSLLMIHALKSILNIIFNHINYHYYFIQIQYLYSIDTKNYTVQMYSILNRSSYSEYRHVNSIQLLLINLENEF